MSRSNKDGKSSFLVEAFDILFVMLLCFVTLLTTMLMRGKVLVGSGSGAGLSYKFNIGSFAFTATFLVIYMIYIIHHSERELKTYYSFHYDLKEKKRSGREKFVSSGRPEV